MRRLVIAAGAAAALGAPGLAHAEAACADLVKTSLPHAQVTAATLESLGQTQACKLSVTSKPTADSDIRIQVWIPLGQAWNGKFVQAGNGGFAGRILEFQLRGLAAQGYAAAGTDGGHQTTQATDATWALGHREKFIDFGWRALKETTEVSKALIAEQKGLKPKRSYFAGCSDGGREALMEAQRFPADFDGIVAGAPANYMSELFGISAAQQQALAAPGGYLGAEQRALLQKAALADCAGGGPFIRDPLSCGFDPGALKCKPGQTQGCLTVAQLRSARAMYDGRRDPRTGQVAFPGFTPGAESAAGSWSNWITGESEADHGRAMGLNFSANAFKYFAFGDPSYDFLKMNLGSDFDRARARMRPVLDSDSPDLAAFKRRGGKLIQYHGWNDPAIPARSSIRYYEDVRRTMGDPSDFYRLYLVPGMLHCGGGPGPGQVDWIAALDGWVTEGKAPGPITAEAGRNPQAVEKAQLLCPYPTAARKSADRVICSRARPPGKRR